MVDFYPDIFETLDGAQNSYSVTTKGFEDIIAKLRAKTGLSTEVCSKILRFFLQEIRNAMLRGEQVSFRNFGTFVIISPVTTGASRLISPRFFPSDKILAKINE